MNILYDCQIYRIQNRGGINRYFSNLISRLPKELNPIITVLEDHICDYPTHPNLTKLEYKKFKFRPRRLASKLEKHHSFLREQYLYRTVKEFNNLELAHPTSDTLLTQNSINNYPCPVVITVHDMIPELFPDLVYKSKQQIEDKKNAIYASQAIICVSENTKNDLLNLYKLPEEKVFVTHLASEISEDISYGTESVPHRPYFLFVGSRYMYKNFDNLLLAFSKLVSACPEVSLCVVGLPFSVSERLKIADLHLETNIDHYFQVNDSHLAKLYRCSLALVYPSIYEGFGLPPLEAMSCNTPVVASNSSSLPEVIGDAGILFDPNSITDLVDILLLLINSPHTRERLIAEGKKRVKCFDWEKTTRETIEVYKKISY